MAMIVCDFVSQFSEVLIYDCYLTRAVGFMCSLQVHQWQRYARRLVALCRLVFRSVYTCRISSLISCNKILVTYGQLGD